MGLALAGIVALTHGSVVRLDPLGVVSASIAGGLWGTYIATNARVGRVFADTTGLTLALCVGRS